MASAQSLSSVNSDPWHILRGIILGYQRASTGSLVPAAVEAMMLKRSIFLGTTWMNHQHRSTGDLLMLGKPECRGINHSIFSCPDNIDSGFPQTDPFLSAVYTKIIRALSFVSDWAVYHVPPPEPGAVRDSGGLSLRAGLACREAAISS